MLCNNHYSSNNPKIYQCVLLMAIIIAMLKQNMRYHIKHKIKLRKILNRIFQFFRAMNVLCVVLDYSLIILQTFYLSQLEKLLY